MSIYGSLSALHRAAEAGTVTVTASGPASADAVRDRETGLKPHFGSSSGPRRPATGRSSPSTTPLPASAGTSPPRGTSSSSWSVTMPLPS